MTRGHWRDKANQKAFFDKLADKWNVEKKEDWNRITTTMVFKEGGKFINRLYNGSLTKGMDTVTLLEILFQNCRRLCQQCSNTSKPCKQFTLILSQKPD
jgi:hypothetical protein